MRLWSDLKRSGFRDLCCFIAVKIRTVSQMRIKGRIWVISSCRVSMVLKVQQCPQCEAVSEPVCVFGSVLLHRLNSMFERKLWDERKEILLPDKHLWTCSGCQQSQPNNFLFMLLVALSYSNSEKTQSSRSVQSPKYAAPFVCNWSVWSCCAFQSIMHEPINSFIQPVSKGDKGATQPAWTAAALSELVTTILGQPGRKPTMPPCPVTPRGNMKVQASLQQWKACVGLCRMCLNLFQGDQSRRARRVFPHAFMLVRFEAADTCRFPPSFVCRVRTWM